MVFCTGYCDPNTQDAARISNFSACSYVLLYKIKWFIDFSATNKIDNLTCVIIHDIFLYNKQKNTWMLENMKLFLSGYLTRSQPWSTLEIYSISPHTMNYSLCNILF